MDVRWFLFSLLLTVTCPALLHAQSQEGGLESSDCSCRGEVDELKNITLTLLKEFLSFSASVKADLTAVKLDLTTLRSELGQVESKVITNRKKIKDQGATLDGFQSQLDSIQQTVERDLMDQGGWLFNQTSILVSQLADQQGALYLNLSNEVISVCSAGRDDPPTQANTTEPPASTQLPTGTTVLPTSATEPVTCATESPTIEGYSCGGTSGWRRVAFLNMTDPTHQCPSGWRLTDYSKRTCGRHSSTVATCDSATFSTGELNYSRVCGRIFGYQFGELIAFYNYYSSSMSIESQYVTGLSITHGSPRQHIWTFAGGLIESRNSYTNLRCPCDGGTSPVPDFVGSDYFCESGINGPWISQLIFHPEDRLWDGENCGPTSSCCEDTTLPYFVKELNSTADNIETRICNYHTNRYNDLAIELVELYVQ